MFRTLAISLSLLLTGLPLAASALPLTEIAADPLTFIWPAAATVTEHQTDVEPVVATNGRTTVIISQVGRFYGDAAQALAFSTYIGGAFVDTALLPGLTTIQTSRGNYDRITYESIAWNAKYRQFIVAMLPISNVPDPYGDDDTTLPVITQRSPDGINWGPPQTVFSGGLRPEKSWIACDNFQYSPHYGNCYITWDDNVDSDRFHMNTSTNGGQSWGPTLTAPDGHSAFGSVPVVQPTGKLVIPAEDSSGYEGTAHNIISFVSTDGGRSVSPAFEVASIISHTVAANMRTQSLPTVAIDPTGSVYAMWQDCRFRPSCSSNDIVLGFSTDGVHWQSPARMTLDSVNSGVDRFLPSLAIRNNGYGWTFGLSYYEFPNANCSLATCALLAAFQYSSNARQWSPPTILAGPMSVTSLASTSAGYMIGDYLTSVFPANYIAPLAIGLTPPPGFAYSENIYMPYQGGFLGPSLADTGSLTTQMRTAFPPERDALRRFGLITDVVPPAHLAPKIEIRFTRHPM
jgi:hypothetical protein